MEVSGFERGEILGQPHNMVRHPDMPQQAFADMWATLKGGQAWTALVKNRRKDGDHYWVRANATPVKRGGKVVGYMSVRTKPAADEVVQAEDLYRKVREGTAGAVAFHKGIVVRTGLLGWMSMFQVMPVRWRIRLAAVLGILISLATSFLVGIDTHEMLTMLGGAALSAIVVCLMLEVQVARPLQTLLHEAEMVASGQTADSANLNRVDEIGMLQRSINQAG